jgi:hypothetical protein
MFQDMKSKGKIDISRNFEQFDYQNTTILVFIDDFIGTGDSFLTAYKERQIDVFIGNSDYIDSKIYLLAAIVMNKGLELLKFKIPELVISAEVRYNSFSRTNSPFVIAQGPSKMKAVALKYGQKMVILRRGGQDIYYPLGYGGCEALVSFDYGPPNNTIPIIWSSDKWHPIFPRVSKDKISQAKELKKSVAFYIGVMKMLKLDLYTDENILINGNSYKYDSRMDHSLITVLYLLAKKYNEILICQIIGITMTELKTIYGYGIKRKLLDTKNQLTFAGAGFLSELTKVARNQTFRSKKRANFEINSLIYIPQSFKGQV